MAEEGQLTAGRSLMAPPVSLAPLFTRQQLGALAPPALLAVAEALGTPQQNPTVNDLLAQQDSGEWFPFIRAWNLKLLADARVLAKARELAGVVDDADADADLLLQWRDAVLKFADVTRPALLATQNTLQLEAFRALVAGVDFDGVTLHLARGELRSCAAVKERLGATAGAVFEQILRAERPADELKELQDEIAKPSDGLLRLGKLKRHKRMLDMLSQQQQVIDLTIRDRDDEDELAAIIACQNTLRGFAAAAGLNARGTPKLELSRKIVGAQTPQRRPRKVAKEAEAQEEASAAAAEPSGEEPQAKAESQPEAESRAKTQAEAQAEAEPPAEHEADAREPEDVDEEPDDWKAQLQAELSDAECSTTDVLDMLVMRKNNVLALELEVKDPSAESAGAVAGAALARDVERLRALLQSEPLPTAVEGWGQLLRWWRLMDRAYAFHGLMEHLREGLMKSKRGKESFLQQGRATEEGWHAGRHLERAGGRHSRPPVIQAGLAL
jgi:hypothetical protein